VVDGVDGAGAGVRTSWIVLAESVGLNCVRGQLLGVQDGRGRG